MRNFIQEAIEVRKHLISPYNSGKEIIRSIITSAEEKASKSRGNKNALATLEGWTDSIVDDDYTPMDEGIKPDFDTAPWDGETITEIAYE